MKEVKPVLQMDVTKPIQGASLDTLMCGETHTSTESKRVNDSKRYKLLVNKLTQA